MLQKTSLKARTGGQVLVDQLLIHGADTAYCVPGESYLEVLDALHDVQDRRRSPPRLVLDPGFWSASLVRARLR